MDYKSCSKCGSAITFLGVEYTEFGWVHLDSSSIEMTKLGCYNKAMPADPLRSHRLHQSLRDEESAIRKARMVTLERELAKPSPSWKTEVRP